jgi:hypothetical protein
MCDLPVHSGKGECVQAILFFTGGNHQGVIRLHGICIDALPNLYLVTETALGGTLETLLATDGMPHMRQSRPDSAVYKTVKARFCRIQDSQGQILAYIRQSRPYSVAYKTVKATFWRT